MTVDQPLLLDSRVAKYDAIRDALAFSRETLQRIRRALHEALGAPRHGASPFVAVSGSLARLEAAYTSDVDCMIVYPGAPPDNAPAFRDRVYETIASVQVKTPHGESPLDKPNPRGVFAGDASGVHLVEKIGSRDEEYDNIARRLLLLLESQPLWNDSYFTELRATLIHAYAKDVSDDETKHFVLLINDLIRYFRTIAVNYHAVKENEPAMWPIRNVKLRHSRILMYTSLLYCLGELSKFDYSRPGRRRTDHGHPPSKAELLRAYVEMPALERFVHLYEENSDDNLFRLLAPYNHFLEALGERSSRDELRQLDYQARYRSRTFAALKTNSDAFAAELMRFLFARRGSWSDRFYEYLVL